MTLNQLRCFVELAYSRNFSAASRRLFMTQPNLTKQIAAMEKELGIKLFNRTTHRVELTQAGVRLLAAADRYYIPLQRSISDLQADHSSEKQTFTIGTIQDELIPEYIQDILSDLNRSDSPCRFCVVQDPLHGSVENLIKLQYDLIISSDREALQHDGIEFIRLRPFQLLLAVSRNHPLADKEDLTPLDFGNEPIYFAPPRSDISFYEFSQAVQKRLGGSINIRVMNSHSDTLSNVRLCAGAGIVVCLVDQERYPDILFREFERREHPAYQYLIWRRGEENHFVKDFVARVREQTPPAFEGVQDPGAGG